MASFYLLFNILLFDLFWSITKVALVAISLFLTVCYLIIVIMWLYCSCLRKCVMANVCVRTPPPKYHNGNILEGIPRSGVVLVLPPLKGAQRGEKKRMKKCLKVSFFSFFFW